MVTTKFCYRNTPLSGGRRVDIYQYIINLVVFFFNFFFNQFYQLWTSFWLRGPCFQSFLNTSYNRRLSRRHLLCCVSVTVTNLSLCWTAPLIKTLNLRGHFRKWFKEEFLKFEKQKKEKL